MYNEFAALSNQHITSLMVYSKFAWFQIILRFALTPDLHKVFSVYSYLMRIAYHCKGLYIHKNVDLFTCYHMSHETKTCPVLF